ncbi:hypothetical protein HY641_01860 [Candidatus Woesearchaeota archaeon]|nr:hypothetical protein [Candidatus Woesearchaeota archaeon]
MKHPAIPISMLLLCTTLAFAANITTAANTLSSYNTYESLRNEAAMAASLGNIPLFKILASQARKRLAEDHGLAESVLSVEATKTRIAALCPRCAADLTPEQLRRYSNTTLLLANLAIETQEINTHRAFRRFDARGTARNVHPQISRRSTERAVIQEAQARALNDLGAADASALCSDCPSSDTAKRKILTDSINAARILLNATKHRLDATMHITNEEHSHNTLITNEAMQRLDLIQTDDIPTRTLQNDTFEALTEATQTIIQAYSRMNHESAGARFLILTKELHAITKDPHIPITALENPNMERAIDELIRLISQTAKLYEDGKDNLEDHDYAQAQENTLTLTRTNSRIEYLTELIT